MQEKAGAEPKRQPTRLGLGNKRERAGRGKGRPRKAKRGSNSRAGAGGGAGRGGNRGGAGTEKRAELGPTQAAATEGARGGPGPARPRQSAPGDDATRGGRAREKPPEPRPGRQVETRCHGLSPSRQGTHLLAAGALRESSPVSSDRLSRIAAPD